MAADDLSIKVSVDPGPALADIAKIRAALESTLPVSPRLSFKGWALNVWLAKNKNFVKSVLAPVTAIITSGTVVPEMIRPALLALGLGVLTIVSKLGWDAFDYFVSEPPLEPRP